MAPALHSAMRHDGPVVADFRVTSDENIYPMVPPGASLDETLEAPASPTDKAAKQEVKA